MEFLKKNIRTIIGFIIGIILASSITVYAYSYFASDIKYTDDKSVADALNELYQKKNSSNAIFSGVVGYEVLDSKFYYSFNSIDVNTNVIKNYTNNNSEINDSSLTISLTMNSSCNIKIQIGEANRGTCPTVIGEIKKNGTTVNDLSSISVENNDIITIYFNNSKSSGGGNSGGGGFAILIETI